MSIIPLELWKIVTSYLSSAHQLNLKLSCKHLQFNNIHSDSYTRFLQDKIINKFKQLHIVYGEIATYLMQQNDYSISKLKKAICEINTIETGDNCIHKLMKEDHNDSVRCIICGYEYQCERCYSLCNRICPIDIF